MRHSANLLIVILIFIIGCNPHSHVRNNAQVNFEKWLKKYSLTSNNFIDTISQKAFELWAYQVPVEKVPNSFIRIPSIDSSYFLLTNFDKKQAKTYIGSLSFEFLKRETKNVYIGIEILEGKSKDILDCFWFDKATIYILISM